jgi:hypothetical protein
MLEIKAKRTKYTKTFHTGKSRRMLLVSPYPLHKREEKWREINLKPEETENGYKLETDEYSFELIKFPFEIKFNERSVRSLDSPNTNHISLTDKGILIKEAFPNLDILIRILPESVMVFLKFKEGKYELNWKAQDTYQEVHNYDVPMTVKSMHFGKKPDQKFQRFEYPELPFEGQIEFTKLRPADHFEELPCMEIYYVS